MNKELKKVLTGIIFHNLRTLHGITPRDTYILNYRNHLVKHGDDFFDIYHLAAYWGAMYNPKKIIEIGSRTGLSLVQLLSTCIDYKDKRVVLFDRWDDGLSTPDLIKKHLNHLSIPTDFIEFYEGDSKITVPKFKKTNKDKFDWILVDGAHLERFVTIDLENVLDLVAKNGLIVIDDIASAPEDNISVRPAWKKFKIKHSKEFSFQEDLFGKGTGWGQKL